MLLFLFTQLSIAYAQEPPRPRPAGQQRPAPRSQASQTGQRFVSIDFNDVDINVFIKFISELTGKNFIIDNRVKGKVTIISPAKISVKEAYKVFESVLEVHGFTTVPSGKVIKIVRMPDARSKSIETKLRAEADSPADKIVTQLIPLTYADPTEIKRLFTPLVSKSSTILAYAPTNMVIVTDIYSNIKRLLRILKAIDVPGVGQEITVIPLDYADATKLVKTLTSIFQSRKRPAKKGVQGKQVSFVADERTNTIVLVASEDQTKRVKKLIAMLDKETPTDKGKIRVYYLENAVAEELAKVLQDLPGKQSAAPKGAQKAPVISGNVRISADKATNSLIITADADDYLVLEDIIEKLDIPRSMVYIESMFMEVSVNKGLDLGIDWTALGSTKIGDDKAITGGGFNPGGATNPGSLLDPSTNRLTNPTGFSLGVITEPITIAGISVSSISAIFQALKTDEDVQILSTPQVLTMDNEEARITIADNIPFQTTATTTTSSDTFNSFEYRDVGKILKITPHISKGRLVRMKIELEVSTALDTTTLQPTTAKRTVETTVIVKDNHTVVIGGLIDDTLTDNQSKVPCLGEVPFAKYLFQKQNKDEDKTNLYVFITPRVISNPAEADAVYRDKKSHIDSIRGGNVKMYGDDKKPAKPAKQSDLPAPIESPEAPPETSANDAPAPTDATGEIADRASEDVPVAAVTDALPLTAPMETTPAADSAEAPAPAAGYTIQVAAFRNQKDADQRTAKLKQQGLDAYTTVSTGSGSRWYRVRIGKYKDRKQALEMIDQLKSENITAILVKI